MRLLSRLSAVVVAAIAFAGSAAATPKDDLSGHYYLEGGPSETGSELLLKKDGKFQWMLSYGAQDHGAQGTWQLKDQKVILSTIAVPMKYRLFTEKELDLNKPPKAGSWVAVVGVPDMGPIADVEVKFEAKSGKSAIAISAGNGDAIVSMPAGEQWSRTGLRRSNGKEEWDWVAVTPVRSEARIAGFALTNPLSIQRAFATLELKREKAGLVVAGEEGGLRGTYVRRP